MDAAHASRALVVFLGTSIFGTVIGGWLADRFGRRTVIRAGFGGAVVFLALFISASDQNWAMAPRLPLAIFIFMPTSVLVVLGQEYLPRRVGMASGVTLGLAVSVGGMCPVPGPDGGSARVAQRPPLAADRAGGGDRPGVRFAPHWRTRTAPARYQSGARSGKPIGIGRS